MRVVRQRWLAEQTAFSIVRQVLQEPCLSLGGQPPDGLPHVYGLHMG
jgi:hypothetical protein